MITYLWQHRVRHPLGSRRWFKQWAKRAWETPALIKFAWNSAVLTWRGANIGQGTLLSPIQVVGDLHALSIGSHSFIGRVEITLDAGVQIGSNVCLNNGVRLITGSHDVQDPEWKMVGGPIQIRDYAWLATGAVILPGVTIGQGAVVGAYSVVARDVPDYAVATGNPARFRENARNRNLRYFPGQFLSFQTAWLGRASAEL